MIFTQRQRQVASLVKMYAEGRRLMRHGDGADEWLGMSFARDARDQLEALGYDEDGHKLKACRSCGQRGIHIVVTPHSGASLELRVPSYYSCTQRLVVPDPAEVEQKHLDRHWNGTCPYTIPEGCRIWRDLARPHVEPIQAAEVAP